MSSIVRGDGIQSHRDSTPPVTFLKILNAEIIVRGNINECQNRIN